jgi:hypothetical protein
LEESVFLRLVNCGPANIRAVGDLLIGAQQGDPSQKKFHPRLQSLGPAKPKRRVAGLARLGS